MMLRASAWSRQETETHASGYVLLLDPTTFDGSFLGDILEKLDPDLDATLKGLNSTEGKSDEPVFNDPPKERNSLLEDLHFEYLSAMKSTSEAKLEKVLLEAQIKAACGRAKGISDVCAWSRELTTGKEFDTSRFKKEHEELARQFTKQGTPKSPVPLISPRRSYPVGRR